MRNIFGDQGNMEGNFWEQGNSVKMNFGEHLNLFLRNKGTTVNFHREQGNTHPPLGSPQSWLGTLVAYRFEPPLGSKNLIALLSWSPRRILFFSGVKSILIKRKKKCFLSHISPKKNERFRFFLVDILLN